MPASMSTPKIPNAHFNTRCLFLCPLALRWLRLLRRLLLLALPVLTRRLLLLCCAAELRFAVVLRCFRPDRAVVLVELVDRLGELALLEPVLLE